MLFNHKNTRKKLNPLRHLTYLHPDEACLVTMDHEDQDLAPGSDAISQDKPSQEQTYVEDFDTESIVSTSKPARSIASSF